MSNLSFFICQYAREAYTRTVEPSTLERKACCLHLGIRVQNIHYKYIHNVYLKIKLFLSNAILF